ncbi:uncharacterized mitochondrial protein AtMg00860-like [Solanum dulcamara]|uniref:uncharacterized mitochondrial protein AtMg00860-like n=1 Tax=Solanum dulcamara TaxID=45834 RepID=UPI0024865792|nr:uncharacterized mitochondrial protein AtMg00860-like [Solanum dulcamara]
MLFGLTNAPTTFCTLSNTLAEHVEHLKKVFQVLRENDLYIKWEKYEFSEHEVHFLGYVISHGKQRMDEAKVQAIKEWEASTKVTKLRSFLGLANYYRRFISGYSDKATLLTKLLKKNKLWVWREHCRKAFEELKAIITEKPVLAMPDFSKTFRCTWMLPTMPLGEY